MEKARVIITFECKRSCENCCNKYTSIMKNAISINNLNELDNYDEISITGGEPMLNCIRTSNIIKYLRNRNPNRLIYLYTAFYSDSMSNIINLVDGIQFSLHDGVSTQDISGFVKFQEDIKDINKSFRLYVEPTIEYPLTIIPNRWKRIKMNNCY